MKWARTLQMVDVHCEGEIGKVITAGVLGVPGATMLEKMHHINSVDDSLIRLCLLEPRGFAQMAVNLLQPPSHDEADAGFIVLLADGAHSMSGSNCICVVTTLLETGMLPISEPETVVTLDTPAGLVRARANCSNGRVKRVTLEMPVGFLAHSDVTIEVEGIGPVRADVAFGGEFYVLVESVGVGIAIMPDKAHLLARASFQIQKAFAQAVRVQHPLSPSLDRINNVMFYEQLGDREYRTCTSGMTGRVDRSPCGTGSTALLAALEAKGQAKIGDTLLSRSIIGSIFQTHCKARTALGAGHGVKCELTGRAWIFGFHQLGLDPEDPFAKGFALTDTWGPGAGALMQNRDS